jgi:hypothetical protein
LRSLCLVLLVLIAPTVQGQDYAAWIDEVLKTPPSEAVERAIRRGDSNYWIVAGCAEMIPGYPGPTPSNPNVGEPKPLRKVGPSCQQLLGKELAAKLRALSDYADQYNQLMYEQLNDTGLKHEKAR